MTPGCKIKPFSFIWKVWGIGLLNHYVRAVEIVYAALALSVLLPESVSFFCF